MHLLVNIVKNNDQLKEVLDIRKEVFVKEQNVDINIEIDEYDDITNENCIHYYVSNGNQFIACARLLIYDDYIKIGRVACLKKFRGNGVINKLFEKLIADCFNTFSDKKNILIESQLAVVSMYEKYGFIKYGDMFLDANIKHYKMKRQNISPFYLSHTNKRYYTANHYFKTKYSEKIGRVMLDAGFTCPNIDGTVGYGGCSFCSINGSGDFAGKKTDSLLKQWDENLKRMHTKWPNAKGIAYFQAYSNTYSSIDNLMEKFETFKNIDQCIGIAIGTRPDCLDEEKVKYLSKLSKEVDLYLEIGLQTINETTATNFNRGYELEVFTNCINLLNKYDLKPIIHIINGLPGDNEDDNINTVKYLNQFELSGIKIHMLHILEKTKMGFEYKNNEFELLTQEQYINTVVKQIAILNPNVIIHRLTGDAPSDMLIAPMWTKNKTSVLNEIDKLLTQNNIYQGCNYESK